MEQSENLFFNNNFASKYDDLVRKQNWYGSEVLFGMIYERIKSGDKILDLGIGTGLSAFALYKVGLEVYGLDYSLEMLKICEEKGFTKDLKQFDLNDSPLPYPDQFFDHISANAILYFIENLEALFKEVSRIAKRKGIWAFIIEKQTKKSGNPIVKNAPGKNGLITYQHSHQYISSLLELNGLTLLKELEFTCTNFQMEGKTVPFSLYVAEI